MRAAQLTAINQLSVTSVAAPKIGKGEALVHLKAAALNHRDHWIKQGQYAGLKFPCIPGSDGAGVVTFVDPAADKSWKGKEVVINPSFDWGDSERSQGSSFSILGLPRQGTLAEQVAVPVSQLAVKPPHLSWAEAAALPLAGLTAYRALFSRARIEPSDRVLITGIGGGVALFALQFAVALGAQVWVTSSSREKIARAVSLGARGGFDYSASDWVKLAASSQSGFDLIFDSAGGPGFEGLIDLVAQGGRIVFCGATHGNPPLLPMRKVFWRQITLLGTTMGSPQDWAAMLAFVARHQLRPMVSRVFPLDSAADAFQLMERNDQFGKIVVTIAE
ncbi:MAG TPA: zinc-binding dehydrogenase [Opitutaceae bacterium]|nr:zinc-binding dehydrogenase [Opitutaceae bacterium]